MIGCASHYIQSNSQTCGGSSGCCQQKHSSLLPNIKWFDSVKHLQIRAHSMIWKIWFLLKQWYYAVNLVGASLFCESLSFRVVFLRLKVVVLSCLEIVKIRRWKKSFLYHIDFRAFTLEMIKMEVVGWKTFKIFLPLLVLMPAPANCKLVIEAARSTIILISQNVWKLFSLFITSTCFFIGHIFTHATTK